MKGIMIFEKKGKLSPRYLGLFEIVNHVGQVAYELTLPAEISAIDNMFHVLILKKYIAGPEHVITPQTVQIQANLNYEEKPIQILDREVKKLRDKEIVLVKVLWHNHKIEEATSEPEEEMRKNYPKLF